MQSKTKAYLRTAAATTVVLGGTGFFMRRDPEMPLILGIVIVCILTLYAVFASSQMVAFINRHPRKIFAAGVLVMIAGFAAFTSAFFIFPNLPSNNLYLNGGFLAVMFFGCTLLTLPRSAKRYAEVQSQSAIAISPAITEHASDADTEVTSAYIYVYSNFGAFLRIVLPWILAWWLLPLIAMQAAGFADGSIKNLLDPLRGHLTDSVVITTLFAFAIAQFSAIPISTLYWQRFVLGYKPSKKFLPFPSQSTLKYLFILWISGSILSTFGKMIAPDVAAITEMTGFLPADAVKSIVSLLLWAGVIWLFAPTALLLPAAAVGDKRTDLHNAMRIWRLIGSPSRSGLILAVAPAVLFSVVIEKLLEKIAGPSVSIAQLLSLGPAIAYFFGLTVATTYLARTYQTATRKFPAEFFSSTQG